MLFHIDLVLVLFRTSACPQRTEDIDGDFQVNKNDACFMQVHCEFTLIIILIIYNTYVAP